MQQFFDVLILLALISKRITRRPLTTYITFFYVDISDRYFSQV